jgi:small subunit ribosomal protein S5|uniref:Small ribosomal subunit protein uS5c n=1 Tax=Vaucheria litorea TaxID=109269 RepID=B7T1W8_VAULI|nr:ribosomal protein S5 [Vaucheria litorea]ACF70934.1 ribosomal protein S5 [Vaucheria litorea]
MVNNLKNLNKKNNTTRNRKNKKVQEKTIRWEQRVVQISRVVKVVKGGKKLSFRATVIIGNKNSHVGVGVGKADEVSTAIQKAVNHARKNLIQIPLTKTKTIPHNIIGIDGASKVLIRTAGPGTGVIAGSSIRIVLELVGVQNILAKQLGGNNLLNNARATIAALKGLKTIHQVAQEREISLEKLFNSKK